MAPGGKRPEDLIQEATDDLNALVIFGETAERLSLLGSAHKRRAWIVQGDERRKSLSEMEESYRKAHKKKYDKVSRKMDTYPLLNWLAAEVLRDCYGDKPKVTAASIRELCEEGRAYAQEKERQDPSFWNSVVVPDCDPVEALAGGALGERKQAIVDAYRRAKSAAQAPGNSAL